MDAKDKDESKDRRREETLAQRVGQALDQMNPSGVDECPNAGIIAAYSDHGLALDETARWESHFATCARCRKILRVLAASSDTPLAENEVARLGELVAAARVPARTAAGGQGSKIAQPKAWDWRVRWLAPALGAAAVLAVWFAMRPPRRSVAPVPPPVLVAQAPKEEALPNSAPADQPTANLLRDDRQAAASPSTRQKALTPSLDSENKVAIGGAASANDSLSRVTPVTPDAVGELQKKDEFDQRANEREARSEANLPSPPPAPPPAKVGTSTGAPAVPQSNAKSASDLHSEKGAPAEALQSQAANALSLPQPVPKPEAAAGAVAQAETSSRPSTNAQSRQAFGALKAKEPTPPVLVRSPVSDAVLWRAGSGGTIERSTDSGRSWAPQSSPAREDWLSGAAVSNAVCWLAGRNGAIARTEDGAQWDRVPPPMQAARSDGTLPDWTVITVRDAQTATVTASDGRRFATADGGKTWQAQP